MTVVFWTEAGGTFLVFWFWFSDTLLKLKTLLSFAQAALIMQVLQLTADQIAMLPPEQRQSILILKEQIQKSTGAP